MANDIDIRIGATDLASAVINKIAGGMGGMASAVGAASAAFGTMAAVARESINTYVKYAEEVRDLSRLTGENAEETSRMIQIADDAKVTYNELTTALKYAVRQGIDPSVESIAKLSDQYLQLEPGLERSAFLMENFGRQGTVMAELMEQGSGAIQEMSGAVNENLILTQKEVEAARKYERTMDELNDSIEGLKIALGEDLLPELILFLSWVNKGIKWVDDLHDAIEEAGLRAHNAATDQHVYTMALQESILAHRDLVEITNTMAEAAYYSADAFGDIVGLAEDYQSIMDDIAAKEAEIALARTQGYKDTGSKIRGLQGELDALRKKEQEVANSFVLDAYKMQIAADGIITEDEMANYFGMAEAFGIIGQEAGEAALKAYDLAEDLGALEGRKLGWLDYYIIVHGGIPTVPGTSGAPNPSPTGAHPTAAGGPAINPGGTIVGERGWEYIDPGGYVHSHVESLHLASVGAINIQGGLQGGGALPAVSPISTPSFPTADEIGEAVVRHWKQAMG